ncbi:MAG: tetratricopeptide repeat protein [Planctomycetes bacterium]|nr:tetratricopeptide repeat protein [Planctomycetota bacterium]
MLRYAGIAAAVLACGLLVGEEKKEETKEEKKPAPSKSETVDTFHEVAGLELGPGSEHRKLAGQAYDAIKKGDLRTAGELLDKAVDGFKALCTDPKKTYISVASQKEVDAYKKEHPDQDVAWLDWGYLEALQLSAFIASAQKRFKPALLYLEEEEKIAPYAAALHNERGYILNQLGKTKEALAEYEKARAIAERFEASRSDLPIALRGIGFSKIDLGDLDGAQKVFEESLKIDPGNTTAISELKFIEEMKAAKGKKGEGKTAKEKEEEKT